MVYDYLYKWRLNCKIGKRIESYKLNFSNELNFGNDNLSDNSNILTIKYDTRRSDIVFYLDDELIVNHAVDKFNFNENDNYISFENQAISIKLLN